MAKYWSPGWPPGSLKGWSIGWSEDGSLAALFRSCANSRNARSTSSGVLGKKGSMPLATAYVPAIPRRYGQVVVVSPFLFQAVFDCALSSTVAEPLPPVP